MLNLFKKLFSSRDFDRQELAGLRRFVIAMNLNPTKVAELGNLAEGNINKTLVLASFQSSTEYFEMCGFSGEELEKLETLASSLRLLREDYERSDFPYDQETHKKIRDLCSKHTRATLAKIAMDAMSGDVGRRA